MRVDQFAFALPQELIALRPSKPRDVARLLVVGSDGIFDHRQVHDFPDLLREGDVLVVNDTKVVLARLTGWRETRDGQGNGARVEVTLHTRTAPDTILAFAKPARRLRPGDRIVFGELGARVARRHGADVELSFDRAGAALDAAVAAVGEMPLPPYIAARRKPDEQDKTDYQTIYAQISGSIAAPTAGLHFTPELMAKLEQRGIGRESLTLHVGPGTFLPVEVEDTKDHRMHAEWATLSAATATRLNAARTSGGRIVAVGTTALRTLETAADEVGIFRAFRGETALFITPGYRFKAVDVLLTNFHLPRSTLFMLVCAFSGTETMKRAYAEAIGKGYRFYSYGDACLLFRPA